MDFHQLTIADRDTVQAVSLHTGRRNCNFTFANLVGWQFWFETEVCLYDKAVVYRFTYDGVRAYMVCAARIERHLLELLVADAGGRLTLLNLDDSQVLELADMGIAMTAKPERNQYDYLYRSRELAELAGGKLKAKRNHVNRFLTEYGQDYEYRELTPAMFDDCRRLESLWRDERGDNNPEYGDTIAAEHRVMETVFAHWNELGMSGGCIYIGNRMVAFTYGAAVTDDTFDVCVEKADRDIDGLFATINQQFAARLAGRYTYINREEDMGLEGLRKSKLSYHPEILLPYNVVQIG